MWDPNGWQNRQLQERKSKGIYFVIIIGAVICVSAVVGGFGVVMGIKWLLGSKSTSHQTAGTIDASPGAAELPRAVPAGTNNSSRKGSPGGGREPAVVVRPKGDLANLVEKIDHLSCLELVALLDEWTPGTTPANMPIVPNSFALAELARRAATEGKNQSLTQELKNQAAALRKALEDQCGTVGEVESVRRRVEEHGPGKFPSLAKDQIAKTIGERIIKLQKEEADKFVEGVEALSKESTATRTGNQLEKGLLACARVYVVNEFLQGGAPEWLKSWSSPETSPPNRDASNFYWSSTLEQVEAGVTGPNPLVKTIEEMRSALKKCLKPPSSWCLIPQERLNQAAGADFGFAEFAWTNGATGSSLASDGAPPVPLPADWVTAKWPASGNFVDFKKHWTNGGAGPWDKVLPTLARALASLKGNETANPWLKKLYCVVENAQLLLNVVGMDPVWASSIVDNFIRDPTKAQSVAKYLRDLVETKSQEVGMPLESRWFFVLCTEFLRCFGSSNSPDKDHANLIADYDILRFPWGHRGQGSSVADALEALHKCDIVPGDRRYDWSTKKVNWLVLALEEVGAIPPGGFVAGLPALGGVDSSRVPAQKIVWLLALCANGGTGTAQWLLQVARTRIGAAGVDVLRTVFYDCGDSEKRIQPSEPDISSFEASNLVRKLLATFDPAGPHGFSPVREACLYELTKAVARLQKENPAAGEDVCGLARIQWSSSSPILTGARKPAPFDVALFRVKNTWCGDTWYGRYLVYHSRFTSDTNLLEVDQTTEAQPAGSIPKTRCTSKKTLDVPGTGGRSRGSKNWLGEYCQSRLFHIVWKAGAYHLSTDGGAEKIANNAAKIGGLGTKMVWNLPDNESFGTVTGITFSRSGSSLVGASLFDAKFVGGIAYETVTSRRGCSVRARDYEIKSPNIAFPYAG